MSYIPFRDNPELAGISDDVSGAIVRLVDQLETAGWQSHHDDSCACDAGRADFRDCVYGVHYVSVSAEEILGLLVARGILDPIMVIENSDESS